MIYLILLLSVIIVNLLPAFAPPTWTVLVFFLVKFNLNIFSLILIGVIGATIGRFILSKYIEWFAKAVFNKKEEENLNYLGQKIGMTAKRNITFSFIYSLTPLSTSALFVAASIAKVDIKNILIGFFFGRLISYTVLALSTKGIVTNINGLFNGSFSLESVLSALIGVLVLLLFVFIDWRVLIEDKKIRLNFHIWKWNPTF